jgi:hypothetical protein
MDHPCAALARDPTQLAHCGAIHAECHVGLGLGAIDRGVRPGVDDDVGQELRDRRRHRSSVGDVQLCLWEGEQCHVLRCGRDQVMAQHPGRTQHHHPHQEPFKYSAFDAR